MASTSPIPADPAWRTRVSATIIGLAILWPALAFSEFKPWLLFDMQSLTAAGRFLAGFLEPAHSPEFLQMVLRETWQTVAIATAGLTLALLGAIPATLIVTERLSISRLGTGRMRTASKLARQCVRWMLVLLRSVPELVWALLFVRVVGLGPTAGVLAIALTYCGMLGKVYAEILESSDAHATDILLAVAHGEADFGISYLGTQEPDLEFEPLFEEDFVLACLVDHPLARRPSLTWAELAQHDCVTLAPGSGNRMLIDQALGALAARPAWSCEVRHVPALLSLIEAGIGVGAVPRFAVPAGTQAGLASVALVEPRVVRTIGLIRRRGRPLSPAAQIFRDLLCRPPSPGHRVARKRRPGADPTSLADSGQ